MKPEQQQILKEILSNPKYKVIRGRLYYYNKSKAKWIHMKGYIRPEGYIQVVLGWKGSHKVFTLHEVVWMDSIGYLPTDKGIYPKDGNWSNCHPDNLGLRQFLKKGPFKKTTPDMVEKIEELHWDKKWNATRIAKYMGMSRQMVKYYINR